VVRAAGLVPVDRLPDGFGVARHQRCPANRPTNTMMTMMMIRIHRMLIGAPWAWLGTRTTAGLDVKGCVTSGGQK
jgi:hypothetical protein